MNVLDHGYLNLVESWGSDERIIEAARMSTGGAFRGWDVDDRLLSYLWTNRHATPFEMGGFVVEVQAPIFVAREWMRHRTQSYNELSARYVELPDLSYVPSIERLTAGKQAKKNKQGSEDGFNRAHANDLLNIITSATAEARQSYEALLELGLARELARLVVPVNQYTRFRASANLRNWLGFLDLRLDPSAQWEIRQYAEGVSEIVKETFPRTFALFSEGRG